MSDCIKRATSTWTSCTCEPCLALRRRLGKLRRAGRITRVPHERAWQRLDTWLSAGYSPAWIASACGLTVTGVQHLATRSRGDQGVMSRHNARAILSADITTATTGHGPIVGATRRLQALGAMGWSMMAVADETGLHFVTLACVQRGAQKRIGAQLNRGITDVHDRLHMTPGPSVRARNDAHRNGWAPPLAWDDIDDPDETPTGVERTITGRKTA